MTKATLYISGMHCVSCAQNIQNALTKLPGVSKARVNYASENALVEFEETIVNFQTLKNTINKLGYKASNDKGQPDTELTEKLVFSIASTILIMLFSMQDMILAKHIVSPATTNLIMLILATPVQFWAGYQFHKGFLNTLKNKSADMNTLISIGTNVAYFYSVYMTLANNIAFSYYDTSAMIITIVMVGNFFEARARTKTSQALNKLMEFAPQEAMVMRDGVQLRISAAEIKVGDTVIVKPGERIATDGVVIDGASSVDEAIITGESMPVDKKAHDNVFGGTINKTGVLKFRVEKPPSENTLAKIAQLLQDAQASKPSIQHLADTVSKFFVPAVLLISVITFAIWYYSADTSYALSKAIAVIVVACPCALGLATPIAVVVFLQNAFQKGIIIKEAKVFETLAKVNTFAFDKTGTLTTGSPNVTDMIGVGGFRTPDLIAFTSSAEKYSQHPIAKAILAKCVYVPPDPEEFKIISGFGVAAKVRGRSVIVGNENLMERYKINISQVKGKTVELENQGKTVIFLAVENILAGIIATQDSLRMESKNVVQWLKNNNIQAVMITGDSDTSAQTIAKEVGIDNVLSKLTPEDKVKSIKELRSKGKIVAMAGDGVNDAPALALANVGISIDAATDIAKEASDITLTSGNLTKIIDAIELSRKAVRTIKQNLWLAFAYNSLLIPIAAGVFYKFGLTLTPEISAVAMSLSSITVVGNSIRQK